MSEISNVSVVIVSYKSEKALFNLLPSIPSDCELIIVNNASEILPKGLQKIRPYIEIQQNQNIGFGKACNLGAKAAAKEFLFFINPDTILEKKCIENLLKAFKAKPNAAAIAPKILDSKGKESFKRRSVLLNRNEWLRKPPKVLSEIPIMTGAAIFIKKEIFIRVGGFDESIFLYHEDDDLSLRLRAEEGPLFYVPNSLITHKGGNSTERNEDTAKLKGFHMGWSRVYAMKKHKVQSYKIKCLFLSLIQLISIEMIFSRRKRYKYISFLRGTFLALKET